jgi:Zn-dependent protease
MFLFQAPAPTRYDLNFSIAGISVRVHPLFWLLAVFLGSGSGDILQILIWVIVVFVSILIHEMGHALAFRRYGVGSHIVLHYMGGLAIPESAPWGTGYANVSPSPKQQIVISLAGPFAGFLLAILVIFSTRFLLGGIVAGSLFGFIPVPQFAIPSFVGNALNLFIVMMLQVNIFWGLINLLPVFPLDGGQVARNVLIQYDPLGGARKSLWLSTIVGALIALAAFTLLGSIYMAFLFGLLAFQSYQSLGAGY